jgi:DNA-binding NarL/FixJ family response regulator
VVDDEDAPRAEIARLLYENGYDVTEANGIESTFARLDETPSEVVVLDMQMPNPNGDAAEAGLVVLRALVGRHMKPAVVILTADATSSIARAARQLGVSSVLNRTQDLEKLPEKVCDAWHDSYAGMPVKAS